VLGKFFTILEGKLFLAALLDRNGARVGVRGGIAKNGGTELFVHQNGSFCLGTPASIAALKPS